MLFLFTADSSLSTSLSPCHNDVVRLQLLPLTPYNRQHYVAPAPPPPPPPPPAAAAAAAGGDVTAYWDHDSGGARLPLLEHLLPALLRRVTGGPVHSADVKHVLTFKKSYILRFEFWTHFITPLYNQ